jgi:hypothetical protein
MKLHLDSQLKTCGLYYKNITIINETSKVVRVMIVSDAQGCGITYGCHSDYPKGVIYAPRKHLLYRCHS